MANLIQAIAAYGPKIDLIAAVEPERFIESVIYRTTISRGVVISVQESEMEMLINFLMEGRPVHTGIAIFTPSIDLQGNIKVNVRVDKRLITVLNIPGAFKGKVKNKENIGKTPQDLAAQWNEDHPDDLVVLRPGFE
jgi:hypothetical protein